MAPRDPDLPPDLRFTSATTRILEVCADADGAAVTDSPDLEPVPMPDDVAAFVEGQVGRLRSAVFCGWDHGVSDVWECRAENGQRLFVKHCRDKYDQERDAYRFWAPHLNGRCPELLGADDSLRVLILSAVDGTLAQDLDPGVTFDVEMYLQAGSVLHSLHELPNGAIDSDAVGAFVRRAESWDRRSSDCVEAADRAWMMARVHEIMPVLPKVRRTPCHRDFTPRNWVVDAAGMLRVIDFGHARIDFWVLDLDKLWSDQWVGRSDRSEAFWDGYGRVPSEDEWAVLEAASALGAISTIAWSREHNDTDYEAHGRRHLARLRASP